MGLHKHLRPFQVNEAYPLGFARVKQDSYLNEETSQEKKKTRRLLRKKKTYHLF